MRAEEMTSNGSPFHTAELPPPRNVGTPDSAETPAPVNTSTRVAPAKRRRSSSEINIPARVCIRVRMVAERSARLSSNTFLRLSFTPGFNRVIKLPFEVRTVSTVSDWPAHGKSLKRARGIKPRQTKLNQYFACCPVSTALLAKLYCHLLRPSEYRK